ncbi:MAG: methyltransferase domain-containing protein [Anaerolineales bacterium]|nr:methyltransferase domain-containing protein [Anaerolineae bacterium]MCB0228112.1 methyltransferase domain-containing protein [Anaerolineae bacterium]MCB9140810.1 methyltransferase domain-containing protein [Anaerolineales bacterium]
MLAYGCGAGGTTVALLKRRSQVTGFDVSATRREDARRLVRERVGAQTVPTLAQSSAEQLPCSRRRLRRRVWQANPPPPESASCSS